MAVTRKELSFKRLYDAFFIASVGIPALELLFAQRTIFYFHNREEEIPLGQRRGRSNFDPWSKYILLERTVKPPGPRDVTIPGSGKLTE